MFMTSSLCSVTTSKRLVLFVPRAFPMYRRGELTRYQSSSLEHIMLELLLRVVLREHWLFIAYTDRYIHKSISMHIYAYMRCFWPCHIKVFGQPSVMPVELFDGTLHTHTSTHTPMHGLFIAS